MALLPILTYPDPVLKQQAEPVSEFDDQLRLLVRNMFETMYAGNGIGLAATQVGVLRRLYVVDLSTEGKEQLVIVNPLIVWRQDEIVFEEGCLSVPDYRDNVTRSKNIVIAAQDEYGKEFELEADGLLSVCLQHELDHLDGVLFIERLSRLKREIFKRRHRKQVGPVANSAG